MKRYAFIDLHIHTENSYEEGCDMPVETLLDTLAAMAEKKGGEVCFAISDHDSMLGCIEADNLIRKYPEKYGKLKFIPGMEFNASLKSVGLNESGHSKYSKCHMLGYDFDIHNINMITFSTLIHKRTPAGKFAPKGETVNTGRQLVSAKKIIEKQYNKKIPFKVYEECMNLSTHQEVRNKFLEKTSEYLNIDKNTLSELIKDTFFKNPLNNGNAVGDSKLDIYDIIDLVHSAGGKVGIAHGNTLKYEKETILEDRNKTKSDRFDEFINTVQRNSTGLDFIELFHNENTVPPVFMKMYKTAKKYNLFITGGSDFHGGILHPNNQLSKVFSKRFEYCSIKGEERNEYKNVIKNNLTELAFADYCLSKSQEAQDNKQYFRAENVLYGKMSVEAIQNIVDDIDNINRSEFRAFYGIEERQHAPNPPKKSKKEKTQKRKNKNKKRNMEHQEYNAPKPSNKEKNKNGKYKNKSHISGGKPKEKKQHKNKYQNYSHNSSYGGNGGRSR